MPVAIWDGQLVKVYVNPMTNQITDAIDSPNWQPPGDTIPSLYNSEESLKRAFPGKEFKIVGVKKEHNNTKTAEQSFGIKVSDVELQNIMIREGGKKIEVKQEEGSMDELITLFTKAAVEANNASGMRDKEYKKGFCNGLGVAITALDPSMKERLRDIAINSKTQNHVDEESFI